MTIEDMFKRGDINIYAHNICINNQIRTLEDLKQHYAKSKTFRNLRYCGEKTNSVLVDAYFKYKDIEKETVQPQPAPLMKKRRGRLQDIITDFDEVIKSKFAADIYIEELKQGFEEYWEEDFGKTTELPVEAVPKTTVVDLEALEQKLKEHWREKDRKEDQQHDVTEWGVESTTETAVVDFESLEQKLDKYWSEHIEIGAPENKNQVSSVKTVPNVTDIVDLEDLEQKLQEYWKKQAGEGNVEDSIAE